MISIINPIFYLSDGCHKKHVKFFEIKWSGNIAMFLSYLNYRPFLNGPRWQNSVTIIELLPSPLEDKELRECVDQLQLFQQVSLKLQKEVTSLSQADVMFKWLASKFPETSCKLLPEFTLKRLNKNFESGIIKVQNNQENSLTVAEAEALVPFLITASAVAEADAGDMEEEEDEIMDVSALLKKAKKDLPLAIGASKYVNVDFVKPTSNVVERLFSKTRKVWREDRKKMTPSHMEMVMFLSINRDLWDEMLVWKCRTNPRRRRNLPVEGARLIDELAAANQGGAAAEGVQNPVAVAAALEAFNMRLHEFVAEMDNDNMGEHVNVFLPNGNDQNNDLWDDIEYWEDAIAYFEEGY